MAEIGASPMLAWRPKSNHRGGLQTQHLARRISRGRRAWRVRAQPARLVSAAAPELAHSGVLLDGGAWRDTARIAALSSMAAWLVEIAHRPLGEFEEIRVAAVCAKL